MQSISPSWDVASVLVYVANSATGARHASHCGQTVNVGITHHIASVEHSIVRRVSLRTEDLLISPLCSLTSLM